MKGYLIHTIGILLVLSSCKENNQKIEKSTFEHTLGEGPKPWTSAIFEPTEDDFTFAIISDLNGGERDGVYSAAVEQLNALDPTFVLSVGDLIDGGTEDTLQLAKEWDSFENRTSKLKMPFFHLGGNHDLTNPTMRSIWKQRFGPRYYHFLYDNVLFLMMDSEDYEERRMVEIYEARAKALKVIAGEIEGVYEETEYYNMPERQLGGMSLEQFEYFEKVLEENSDVTWIFVLMHKPLWQREDEKGLNPLENLLADRPYTVINGHIHSFSHQIRNNRDYIILGTTGGGQNVKDSMAFDHISLVRMAKEPVITHLKMEGILDKKGELPKSGSLIH
ncbi:MULTISPECIES: metallophosphoesterase family protein [Maribacter]|uniref:Metallophosphoesterase n=1 Tax=Maribacter flavus TaxID=1658664 RepID=A0ABU7IKH7_9FLAO|nr:MULTISPECIES: metallophosphoesterase [Maribacter]MDC6406134.1 metallophosphoesterase [Maribacter sp. PR66]MEE1973081.1 metallophosphoesterase [Maribacter flavus]